MIASTEENKGGGPAPATSAGERPPAPDTPSDGDKPSNSERGQPREHGGPAGPEPTRYGDWERKGRCIDF